MCLLFQKKKGANCRLGALTAPPEEATWRKSAFLAAELCVKDRVYYLFSGQIIKITQAYCRGFGNAEGDSNALICHCGEDLAVTDGVFVSVPGKQSPDKLSGSSSGFCGVHKSLWQPGGCRATFITEG